MIHSEAGMGTASAALVLVPLFVLSLVLVNAQAVTALTTERDVRALDLLLVTDLTAKEFVFGKLGGVFYNTKEMVLVPMALCGFLWLQRAISGEDLIYLIGGLAVMNAFVAMLGIHAGMAYDNSRTAIGVSLGMVFFLFVGIATCMAHDDCLQRIVPLADPAVLWVYARRRRGALRVARLAQPVVGDRCGFDALSDCHVLGNHQLLAAIHAERVSGHRGDVRFCDRGHAGAGDLRIRRGHRADDRRRRVTRMTPWRARDPVRRG